MVRRRDDESPQRERPSAGTRRPALPSDEIARHLARLAGLRDARRELCELASGTQALIAHEERLAMAGLRRALLQASEQAFASETLRRLVRARPEFGLAEEAGLGALLDLPGELDPLDLAHPLDPRDHEESP